MVPVALRRILWMRTYVFYANRWYHETRGSTRDRTEPGTTRSACPQPLPLPLQVADTWTQQRKVGARYRWDKRTNTGITSRGTLRRILCEHVFYANQWSTRPAGPPAQNVGPLRPQKTAATKPLNGPDVPYPSGAVH
jgi:hypothetical protein